MKRIEPYRHIGVFLKLEKIMIVLGFNTVMSGKTTIDQMKSSQAIVNSYKLITKRKYRDLIQKWS